MVPTPLPVTRLCCSHMCFVAPQASPTVAWEPRLVMCVELSCRSGWRVSRRHALSVWFSHCISSSEFRATQQASKKLLERVKGRVFPVTEGSLPQRRLPQGLWTCRSLCSQGLSPASCVAGFHTWFSSSHVTSSVRPALTTWLDRPVSSSFSAFLLHFLSPPWHVPPPIPVIFVPSPLPPPRL